VVRRSENAIKSSLSFWRPLRSSNTPVAAFARKHGLGAQRILRWNKHLDERPRSRQVESKELSFAPVVVSSRALSGAMTMSVASVENCHQRPGGDRAELGYGAGRRLMLLLPRPSRSTSRRGPFQLNRSFGGLSHPNLIGKPAEGISDGIEPGLPIRLSARVSESSPRPLELGEAPGHLHHHPTLRGGSCRRARLDTDSRPRQLRAKRKKRG